MKPREAKDKNLGYSTGKPRVSVVLLNWNGSDDTIECLNSLKGVQYPNFNVIIVDNFSADHSVDVLKKFKEKNNDLEIKIIENKENLGFSGGNNVGIEAGFADNADYVLWLNNDTVVSSDFLNKLVDASEKDSSVGIATGAIYFYNKPNVLWFGGNTYYNWIKMDKAIGCELFKKEMPEKQKSLHINFITGCCMLVKKDFYKEVGGFDDKFFLYFEDADISLRALKNKWKLLWVPDSTIYHKVSATTLGKMGSPKTHYYNIRNYLLFTKKHGPRWINTYKHLWAGLKLVKQLIKLALPWKKENKIYIYIARGVTDYYRNKFGKLYEK